MKSIPEWKIRRIEKMASEGLSQNDIAEALNISQYTVQKYDQRKAGRGRRKHLEKYYG